LQYLVELYTSVDADCDNHHSNNENQASENTDISENNNDSDNNYEINNESDNNYSNEINYDNGENNNQELDVAHIYAGFSILYVVLLHVWMLKNMSGNGYFSLPLFIIFLYSITSTFFNFF
jgi:hypothetical protein